MLFQVTGISKQYGEQLILENVSLDILGGEIHGIVGYNGAGKSTMARIMAGIIQRDSGKILFDHIEVKDWSVRKALRAGVFYVDTHSTLLPELSVLENMLYGLNNAKRSIFSLILRNQKWIERELNANIQQYGLECRAKSEVASLSTSENRVLELLRVKMFHPRVLLIDEVDSNVNERYQKIMWQIIQELRDGGTAVLYSRNQRFQDVHAPSRDYANRFYG